MKKAHATTGLLLLLPFSVLRSPWLCCMVEWLGGGRESGVRPPALSASALIARLGLERVESPMQGAEHPCVKARAGDPSANPFALQEFGAPGRDEDFISFLLRFRLREDDSMKPMQSHARWLKNFFVSRESGTAFEPSAFFGGRGYGGNMLSWGGNF